MGIGIGALGGASATAVAGCHRVTARSGWPLPAPALVAQDAESKVMHCVTSTKQAGVDRLTGPPPYPVLADHHRLRAVVRPLRVQAMTQYGAGTEEAGVHKEEEEALVVTAGDTYL